MARYLSVYRRRLNYVDLNLQSGPNALIAARTTAASYDFQVASNFDGSYSTFQNVPASGGYASPTVQIVGFDSEQFSQSRTPYLTRFKFNPVDYLAGGAVNSVFTSVGVTDLTPFWIRIIQHNLDGTTNTAESGQLILPYLSTPRRTILLAGTAPSESSLASSLEIQLPIQVTNFQFQNNGSNNLFVAFEPTGPEFTLFPVSTTALNLYTAFSVASQVFVRADGSGGSAFDMVAALRNEGDQ